MGEVLLDVLIDSVKILPFLFLAYLFVELIERKANLARFIARNRYGSIPGALLGLVPQCGFTPAASSLYASGVISLGTLIAVFISTSDEAFIILLSNPGNLSDVLWLLLSKFGIAVVAGLAIDLLIRKKNKSLPPEHDAATCKCCNENLFKAAFKHTVIIFLYILASFLVFETAIYFIGEENVSRFLLKGSFFQPFVTALFGFIPSCASSVLLTDLYIEGALSFPAVLAGLITNSGVGLVILFKSNRGKGKVLQNIGIMGILYFVAVVSGVIFQLFL